MPKFLEEIQLKSLSAVTSPRNGVSIYNSGGVIKILHPDGTEQTLMTGTADGVDLSNYYTKEEIEELLANLDIDPGTVDLSNYYNKEETNAAIDTAISKVIDNAPEAYNTLKEIAEYIESDADAAATMLADIAKKADKSEVYTIEQIDQKLEDLSNTGGVDLSDYYTKSETLEVIDKISGLDNYYDSSTVDGLLENKQPLLISGTNIKTINGESILGLGNIEVAGSGGSSVIANPELVGGEEVLESIQIEDTKYTLQGQDMTFSESVSEDPEAKILKTITIGTDDWKVDKGSVVTPNVELTGDEPVLESVQIDDNTFTLKGEEMIFSETAVEGATVLRNIQLGDDNWAIPEGGSGGASFIFREWTEA